MQYQLNIRCIVMHCLSLTEWMLLRIALVFTAIHLSFGPFISFCFQLHFISRVYVSISFTVKCKDDGIDYYFFAAKRLFANYGPLSVFFCMEYTVP